MTDPLDIASLILAGLLGMVVGGNNLSACSGTIIGSGMVRRRTGIALAIAGYLTGLVLEGPKLFKVREVFLPSHTSLAAFLILLASFLVFLGGELFKIPLSLSKALTGSILGVSVALRTFYQSEYLVLIISFWFLVPIVATGLGLVLVVLDDHLSPRNLWLKLTVLKAGLLPLAFLSAYVLGVNTLGLIAGIPYNETLSATIAVGIGCVMGAFLLGRGALRRLTEGIFSLRYPNAFYAQLVGSATVELANQLAVPLSITETVSSGIIGSGLARRMRVLNVHNIFLIVSSWVLSPIVGFLLAFLLMKVLA
ncbi:MAG TPA: anion permease [Candidatus Dormibacteraeota bacterium]|nr:anion permease [Candidatus Dormibacteraeota bacterium]